MRKRVSTTPLVAELPATVPFVGPEALERQSGRPFRLRIGANESAFGPSPKTIEAMCAAASQVAWYADPENYDLRAAIARHHGVGLENVVVASGIDDLLGLVVRAFLNRGETAVTSLGGYPTFNYHVVGYGGNLHRVPYLNDANDLQALAEVAHRAEARLVYLANPDNPTGTWHTAADVLAFLDRLPEECLLILDEAYIDFAPANAVPTIAIDDPRVLRMRTFSKAYGMAGARVGYALGEAETIKVFEKIRLHFGVNRVAVDGALAALADREYVQYVVTEVARGRNEYVALARELGLSTLPSATNFVAVDVGGPGRARALLAALAGQGVFIRMPGVSPLDRCVRITVGTAEQRATFAEIFRQVWPSIASLSPA